LSKTSKPH